MHHNLSDLGEKMKSLGIWERMMGQIVIFTYCRLFVPVATSIPPTISSFVSSISLGRQLQSYDWLCLLLLQEGDNGHCTHNCPFNGKLRTGEFLVTANEARDSQSYRDWNPLMTCPFRVQYK